MERSEAGKLECSKVCYQAVRVQVRSIQIPCIPRLDINSAPTVLQEAIFPGPTWFPYLNCHHFTSYFLSGVQGYIE